MRQKRNYKLNGAGGDLCSLQDNHAFIAGIGFYPCRVFAYFGERNFGITRYNSGVPCLLIDRILSIRSTFPSDNVSALVTSSYFLAVPVIDTYLPPSF